MNQTPKQQAKAILKDHMPFRVTLVYLIATSGLSLLAGWFMPDFYSALWSMDSNDMVAAVEWNGGLGIFLNLLVGLFGMLMTYGYKLWALRVARGGKPSMSCLIEGFGMTGRVLLLNLLKFMFVYFWTIGLMFSVFMPTTMGIMLFGEIVVPFLVLMMLGAATIGMLCLQIRYCFAEFQLADEPDKSAWNAMKLAVRKQNVDFRKMVQYYLSFWPWLLVYLATTGVYYGLNFIFAYLANPPSAYLNPDLILDLMVQESLVALCISIAVDWLFMGKFLPLFFVGLGVLFDEMKVLEANQENQYGHPLG